MRELQGVRGAKRDPQDAPRVERRFNTCHHVPLLVALSQIDIVAGSIVLTSGETDAGYRRNASRRSLYESEPHAQLGITQMRCSDESEGVGIIAERRTRKDLVYVLGSQRIQWEGESAGKRCPREHLEFCYHSGDLVREGHSRIGRGQRSERRGRAVAIAEPGQGEQIVPERGRPSQRSLGLRAGRATRTPEIPRCNATLQIVYGRCQLVNQGGSLGGSLGFCYILHCLIPADICISAVAVEGDLHPRRDYRDVGRYGQAVGQAEEETEWEATNVGVQDRIECPYVNAVTRVADNGLDGLLGRPDSWKEITAGRVGSEIRAQELRFSVAHARRPEGKTSIVVGVVRGKLNAQNTAWQHTGIHDLRAHRPADE